MRPDGHRVVDIVVQLGVVAAVSAHPTARVLEPLRGRATRPGARRARIGDLGVELGSVHAPIVSGIDQPWKEHCDQRSRPPVARVRGQLEGAGSSEV
ncbi:protein of unknown function [Agreia sp. COWG]|nr:protein of unknown function [Agreia sp. COWG]